MYWKCILCFVVVYLEFILLLYEIKYSTYMWELFVVIVSSDCYVEVSKVGAFI